MRLLLCPLPVGNHVEVLVLGRSCDANRTEPCGPHPDVQCTFALVRPRRDLFDSGASGPYRVLGRGPYTFGTPFVRLGTVAHLMVANFTAFTERLQ